MVHKESACLLDPHFMETDTQSEHLWTEGCERSEDWGVRLALPLSWIQIRSTHWASVSSTFVECSYCLRAVLRIKWTKVERWNCFVNSEALFKCEEPGHLHTPPPPPFISFSCPFLISRWDRWTQGWLTAKLLSVLEVLSKHQPWVVLVASLFKFFFNSQFMTHCLELEVPFLVT